MAEISMQMQYDAWLAIKTEVEALKNLINAGIDVSDANTVAAIEDVLSRLNLTLDVDVKNWPSVQAVKAADTDAELAQLKTELQAINTKLASVLGVSDANTQAQLALVKSELEDIKTRLNAVLNVQLTGSNMEYYGATVADRPAANSVPVGAVFMAVDTQEVWMSNGSTWVEV